MLTPIFEAVFLPCSHGFRQGFSTRSAIAMVEEYRKQGFRWVVDVDFKSYFDTLDHEVLMAKVKERVTDGSILRLIRSWLTAGVMSDGNLTYQTTGTPQGGVISPLLANIYLHSLDVALTKVGVQGRQVRGRSCATKARGCLTARKPCRTEDEGRPLGAAIQVEASNHRKLLWSKAAVVSVTEKAKHDFVR